MNTFNNLKIGTKILSGFIITLVLMLGMGGVAISQLFQINSRVDTVVFHLTEDLYLAEEMINRIYQQRLSANKYIAYQDHADLDNYYLVASDFNVFYHSIDNQITTPTRRALLIEIKKGMDDYANAFDAIVKIIVNRQKMVSDVLDIQGATASNKLGELSRKIIDTDNPGGLSYVELAEDNIYSMRLEVGHFLRSGDEQYAQEVDDQFTQIKSALSKVDETLTDNASRKLLEEVEIAIEAYSESFNVIKQEYSQQITLEKTKVNILGPTAIHNALDITKSLKEELNQKASQTTSLVQTTTILIAVVTACAILFSMFIGVAITRSIIYPIASLVIATNSIAEGDLAKAIEEKNKNPNINRQDEIGIIGNAFTRMIEDYLQPIAETTSQISTGNLTSEVKVYSEKDILGNALEKMILNLRQLALQMWQATANITSSTEEIIDSANEQASTSSEQAAAVAETTSTVEEVRQTTEQTSERTQVVSEMASNSLELADHGLKVVQEMEEGMLSIKEQVRIIAETILALSERTQQIGEIIATVNDIADQSNLLALNAAMEAARAGEAGRGFAVVANEVRNRADQSRQATGQVSNILGDIQKAANKAVLVTEQGTKRAETGVDLTQTTGTTIRSIREQTLQVNQAALQIAASTRQQLAGMDQITRAMENINQGAAQSQTGIHQVVKAAHNLNNLAAELVRVVQRYTIE